MSILLFWKLQGERACRQRASSKSPDESASWDPPTKGIAEISTLVHTLLQHSALGASLESKFYEAFMFSSYQFIKIMTQS